MLLHTYVTILSLVTTFKKEEIHTKLTHEADVAYVGCYFRVFYIFLFVELSCMCKFSSLCEGSHTHSIPHKQPLHLVLVWCVCVFVLLELRCMGQYSNMCVSLVKCAILVACASLVTCL